MKILLANPRGFCAGVERAIAIVDLALERYGPPIYVRHEIVHNRSVVDSLQKKGVVFVDSPAAAPRGSVLIFSAHGVSPAVRAEAEASEHRVIDATCPLVTKVHMEAKRFAAAGNEILLIGHKGHVEVEGTMGEAPAHMRLVESVADAEEIFARDPDRVAILTQTTLSVDDTADVVDVLTRRFPQVSTPKRADICYATQNRQDAVKTLAAACDLVIVVGSENSSNGMRLVETARRGGAVVGRVDDASELDPEWLIHAEQIGIISGAAVPEESVQQVVKRIVEIAGDTGEINSMPAVNERMQFQLPAAVREQLA